MRGYARVIIAIDAGGHLLQQVQVGSVLFKYTPSMDKSGPLSIESLLEKQRKEREAASKVRIILKSSELAELISSHSQSSCPKKNAPRSLLQNVHKKLGNRRRRTTLRNNGERSLSEKLSLSVLRNGGTTGIVMTGMGETIDVSQHLPHLFTHSVTTLLTSLDDDDYDYRSSGRGGRGGRRGRRDDRRDDRGRGHERDRDRPPPPSSASSNFPNVPTGPKADRLQNGASSGTQSSSQTPGPESNGNGVNGSTAIVAASSNFVPQVTEDELSAIRSRYLGVDKKKRKIRKMNDRKFVFDWDEHEDTLADDSPMAMGANRQGAQVMFGRGHLAGMDDGGGSGVRKGTAIADAKFSDALERRKATKSGIDERHWTEKPLSEMKERDWRIFREDFSIAARGKGLSMLTMGEYVLTVFRRRPDTASSPIMVGIRNSPNHSGCHRPDRLQGSVTDSAAGHSHRSSKPRPHRHCGNRFVCSKVFPHHSRQLLIDRECVLNRFWEDGRIRHSDADLHF